MVHIEEMNESVERSENEDEEGGSEISGRRERMEIAWYLLYR